MTLKGSAYSYEKMEDALWLYTKDKKYKELKEYLNKDYKVLKFILQNSLLGTLYSDTEKNWFDIENTYFRELVKIKNEAKIGAKTFETRKLQILNKEFYEIKVEVLKYLKSIETKLDKKYFRIFKSSFKEYYERIFCQF